MKCDKKCDINGICGKYKSKEDKLSLRCSGDWSRKKVEYFKYYTEMFATGMKNKWPKRFYIDLFSGPGKGIVRDTFEEFNGSPLNALNINDKFTHYYFADLNQVCINDLKERTMGNESLVTFYEKDCNQAVKEIIIDISNRSLSLAIIDPSSLQFKFSSYEILAKRKIDFIVNYPIGPVERTVSAAMKTDYKSPVMDNFHPEWRKNISINERTWGNSKRKIISKLVIDYIKKIKNLGYYSSELVDSVAFKNSKNAPLYYLFAFSKDERGIEFWKKAKTSIIKKSPQQNLF